MKILIGIAILIFCLALFFIYENMNFKSYISRDFEREMNIPINQYAPVKSTSTIEIDAPVDTVWKVLTEINEWPSWQENVTEATLQGKLSEGTEFVWKAGGLSFRSQIHTMVPRRKFGWTGKTFGASAIHNWRFETTDKSTVVNVEESLQGVFPKVFKKYFQKNLDQGVKTNLSELKLASETR